MKNQTKVRPYRGQLFLWDTKDVTYLTFFTIFIDFFVGMNHRMHYQNIINNYIF